MVTPFRRDRSIDWQGLDALVDWYVDAGVAGLFAVCLSSEMFEMDAEERFALAARVVQRVDGRLPVVASGTFGPGPRAHIDGIKRMAGQGVAAVVVLASALASEQEDEEAWWASVEHLLHETGDIPLGLYECPKPYHRLIQPGTLVRAVSSGRFLFIKETSGRLPLIKAKLDAVRGSNLRFYNANAETLLESLRLGADGFCGVSANFVPELWVWLCRHAHDEPKTADRLQAFLKNCEQVFTVCYPASAKHFLAMRGLEIGPTCRSQTPGAETPDFNRLEELLEQSDAWRRELGV